MSMTVWYDWLAGVWMYGWMKDGWLGVVEWDPDVSGVCIGWLWFGWRRLSWVAIVVKNYWHPHTYNIHRYIEREYLFTLSLGIRGGMYYVVMVHTPETKVSPGDTWVTPWVQAHKPSPGVPALRFFFFLSFFLSFISFFLKHIARVYTRERGSCRP